MSRKVKWVGITTEHYSRSLTSSITFSSTVKEMFKLAVGSQVDSSLSFLDGFVSEALAAGAAPYKPPHQRQEELAQAKGKNLLMLADLVVLLCFWFVFDCDVCLSIEPGAIRPVPAHQHILLQHRRQTVSYTVVHELWSVR